MKYETKRLRWRSIWEAIWRGYVVSGIEGNKHHSDLLDACSWKRHDRWKRTTGRRKIRRWVRNG